MANSAFRYYLRFQQPRLNAYSEVSSPEIILSYENPSLSIVESRSLNPVGMNILRTRGWLASQSEIRSEEFVEERLNHGAEWVFPIEDGKFMRYPIRDWLIRLKN